MGFNAASAAFRSAAVFAAARSPAFTAAVPNALTAPTPVATCAAVAALSPMSQATG